MISALVASFPRKPRQHLKSSLKQMIFPNSMSLVERCQKIAVKARGPGYLDRDITLDDAAISYFLGLTCGYTFRISQCKLYFGECLTISRALGLHKNKEQAMHNPASPPLTVSSDTSGYECQREQPVDYIRQEIGRRIFWIMLAGVR
jgi:hypothetical protein